VTALELLNLYEEVHRGAGTTATKQNSVDPFEPRYGSCRWAPQSLRVVTLSGMATRRRAADSLASDVWPEAPPSQPFAQIFVNSFGSVLMAELPKLIMEALHRA
jgi:hypothetical protein